jgi:nicotinamide-nucleotide amidase
VTEPAASPSGATTDAATLISRLVASGRTIACAESLTGGLLAATLVDVPGASNAFLGGIVAYATELKRALVDVDAHLLEQRGAVDPEVAEQLADHVRTLCAVGGRPADLGIGTTGVAGPDPQDDRGSVVGAARDGGACDRRGDLRTRRDRRPNRGIAHVNTLLQVAGSQEKSSVRR